MAGLILRDADCAGSSGQGKSVERLCGLLRGGQIGENAHDVALLHDQQLLAVKLGPRCPTICAGERGYIPMSLNLNPAYVSSHWESVEIGAAKTGRKPKRSDWRMVREVSSPVPTGRG